MGTRGNTMFCYLLILWKFAETEIVGDFITPILSLCCLFSGSAWRRICVESIQLCTFWVIKMQKACFLQSGKFSFALLSVTRSPIPYSFKVHVQWVTWNVCVSPTKYLLRNMFSAVWKGKGGKPWKLSRVRMYQIVFISEWPSNQDNMYFLWIFVLVKLKCTNVCLKVCLKSALLWMK